MGRRIRPSRKEIARGSSLIGGRQARPAAMEKAMLRRGRRKRLRYDRAAFAIMGALLLLGLVLDYLLSG